MTSICLALLWLYPVTPSPSQEASALEELKLDYQGDLFNGQAPRETLIKVSEGFVYVDARFSLHIFSRSSGERLGSFNLASKMLVQDQYEISPGSSWIANFTPIESKNLVLISVVTKNSPGEKAKGSTFFIRLDGTPVGPGFRTDLDNGETDVHLRQLIVLDSGKLMANIWESGHDNRDRVDFREVELFDEGDGVEIAFLGGTFFSKSFQKGSVQAGNKSYRVLETKDGLSFVHVNEAKAVTISFEGYSYKKTEETLFDLPNFRHTVVDRTTNSGYDLNQIVSYSQIGGDFFCVAYRTGDSLHKQGKLQLRILNSAGEAIQSQPKIDDRAIVLYVKDNKVCYYLNDEGRHSIQTLLLPIDVLQRRVDAN
jgi:hypothetical protein